MKYEVQNHSLNSSESRRGAQPPRLPFGAPRAKQKACGRFNASVATDALRTARAPFAAPEAGALPAPRRVAIQHSIVRRFLIPIRVVAIILFAGLLSTRAQTTNSTNANPNDFSAFKIISDRNIFDPNRRPARLANHPPEKPKIVDSFSLAGTMSYSKGEFAVFTGSSSEYHKVAEPGEKIASFTVSKIEPDAVMLKSETNEIKLDVGMQLRRNADGNWSTAAAPEPSGNSYASSSSSSAFTGRGSSGSGSPNLTRSNSGGGADDALARMMARRARQMGDEATAPSNPPQEVQGGPTDFGPPGFGPPEGNENGGGSNDQPNAIAAPEQTQPSDAPPVEPGGNQNPNENNNSTNEN